MREEDLRIGNYIGSESGAKRLIEIWGKDERVIVESIIDPCGQIGYDFHQVKYIPITKEELLKFGFDIKELDSGRHHYQNDIGKYKDSKLFEYVIASGDDSHGGWGYETVELHYAHQLQNLHFALTGEELTFK